ncbi:hypothetical protein [Streptomyces sp. V4I2]|uniref:hypothetical protein n=1 Tax=Streptomyces sp. V4I2 TaxID=3042280 RepID=UPI00277F85FF|nr:hypothetical protein [Streptomyces sp. V4I2]MDQ1051917.1 hypothetical protein [Streptomyces sp. V4I2]
MPLSPPAPERIQLLLAQLERYGSRENGQLAVGRRLLQEHPDLPLTGFAISSSMCPEPGRPLHSLILRVGEHDTDGITAWARALGTEPVIDGARYRLDTILDGIGIWGSATIPEDAYDMDQAVFVPSGDDVSFTHRGLLATEFGEDGDLLFSGHPPVREVLAATSVYYRHTCGQRLRPLDGHALADSITRGWCRFVAYPTRTDWRIRRASEDTPGALPVTWMYAQDGHTQDIGDPVRCPACARPSRGLDYHSETGQRVHVCPSPACRHQWPVDDAPSPAAAEQHQEHAALAVR